MEIFSERPHPWEGQARRYITELTDEERALVDAIDLRMWPPAHEHRRVYQANAQPILALLSSLTRRRGIPDERWRYWSDLAYRIDRRGKHSPKGMFEMNGNVGDDAYLHPHFIPYLRYFLFGVYLPGRLIEEFEEQVGNPGWITSGDIVPLGRRARELTKQHSLSRDSAALEFFKLCLDIGLGRSVADYVRRSVMQIRPG